ncbi:MAG: efflux RND transporter periplasmic adaptor subunit [Candidatus Buchananbacteria bacterium]|nr:efflux RND transporter periplasmic adaptor subunit [Candidatus Buchananbacteria bacterium]
MKRLLKNKFFLVGAAVVLVIVLAIILKAAGSGAKVEYTTEEAKKGNLIQTVTASGAVASANEIELNFKNPGKLVKLSVKEGDQVKAQQLLASIDSAGLVAQAAQYRANVDAAKADLEKIKAGSSAEQISVYEKEADKAENDLATLINKRDNELQTLREKSLNELNNTSFIISVALDTIYNYLISDNSTNDLQVSNSSLLNSLEIDYLKIAADFNSLKTKINNATSERTADVIISASGETGIFLDSLNSFLDDSYRVADSIIVNSTYTQTKKDTIKSDISAQQSNSNTSITSIQTTKSNLINSINSYNSLVQAAENSLDIAKAQLNLTKAGPRSFEINAAEAKVAQAQAQLDQTLATLRDYSLMAPIDGTITEINFNLGEQTNVSEPAIKMLSVEKFEIKVDIPESDIAKLSVGDEAVISLDAFGSDHLFAGKVAFIDPAQTVIQDVIYYKTTVSLESNSWSEKVKPGMSADVTVTTDQRENVTYIPQRGVKIKEASLGEVPQKYVEVLLNDNQVQEKPVEIGLRADNGLVEIISGVNEGDKIITFKKSTAK